MKRGLIICSRRWIIFEMLLYLFSYWKIWEHRSLGDRSHEGSDVSSTILPFSNVYARNLECSFERRLGGRHGFGAGRITHTRTRGREAYGPRLLRCWRLNAATGWTTQSRYFLRPPKPELPRKRRCKGRTRTEGGADREEEGRRRDGNRGAKQGLRGEERGNENVGGAASRENKRKMVKEANTKRGVRYDRGRNLLIRP